jgi:hypothetical protein
MGKILIHNGAKTMALWSQKWSTLAYKYPYGYLWLFYIILFRLFFVILYPYGFMVILF